MAQFGPRGCEMKKIRVNARAIVGDIKEHVGLKSLMEKHGLSYRHLLKVKEMLVEKGWVTREELDYLNPADASVQINVSAKDFLASFRTRPDDLHLMERFRLTAKDLQMIYERLIQAGLLSEYEYHCRDRKAPELEDPFTNLSEASTEVTLIKNVFDGGGGVYRADEEAPPRASRPDRIRAYKSSSTRPQNRLPGHAVTSGGRMTEETTLEICPNCGCPSEASSPDACVCCGIIFSKLKRAPKSERTPIWQFDYGIR
jgi:hypothetical protein